MQVRESHNNRTTKYLSRCLDGFGKTFLKELQSLSFYAQYPTGCTIENIGIRDVLYDRATGKSWEGRYIYVVFDCLGVYDKTKNQYIDTKKGKDKFLGFLKYSRGSSYHIKDYWYGKNKHCIVYDMRKYPDAYDMFVCSKYSKMYSMDQLKELGFKPKVKIKDKEMINLTYSVLAKGQHAELHLKHEVYKYYGVEDIAEEPDEYDLPWFIEEEVLNHKYMTTDELTKCKQIKSCTTKTN